jgi:hypothetical protein
VRIAAAAAVADYSRAEAMTVADHAGAVAVGSASHASAVVGTPEAEDTRAKPSALATDAGPVSAARAGHARVGGRICEYRRLAASVKHTRARRSPHVVLAKNDRGPLGGMGRPCVRERLDGDDTKDGRRAGQKFPPWPPLLTSRPAVVLRLAHHVRGHRQTPLEIDISVVPVVSLFLSCPAGRGDYSQVTPNLPNPKQVTFWMTTRR